MSMSLGFTSPSSGALAPEMSHIPSELQVSYLETGYQYSPLRKVGKAHCLSKGSGISGPQRRHGRGN